MVSHFNNTVNKEKPVNNNKMENEQTRSNQNVKVRAAVLSFFHGLLIR